MLRPFHRSDRFVDCQLADRTAGEKTADIRMVMRQENCINPGKILKIDSRIGHTSSCDTRTEMDVVPSMEEVGLKVLLALICICSEGAVMYIGH